MNHTAIYGKSDPSQMKSSENSNNIKMNFFLGVSNGRYYDPRQEYQHRQKNHQSRKLQGLISL